MDFRKPWVFTAQYPSLCFIMRSEFYLDKTKIISIIDGKVGRKSRRRFSTLLTLIKWKK